MPEEVIAKETIAVLSGCAGLTLSEERKLVVLPILQAWLPSANALSARMAQDDVRGQLPGTIFSVNAK